MKHLVLVFFILGAFPASADPVKTFYADLQKVQATYRASQAELLQKADRVVLSLVAFDGLVEEDLFGDDEETILIAPYDKRTKILKSKELSAKEREQVLRVLGPQIAKPEHTGGAFCHYPIHGIRIYQGENLLHEGTFCWVCGNFSFAYPEGADWLDTTVELKKLFTSLLPIPQKELERFYEKYPRARPQETKE